MRILAVGLLSAAPARIAAEVGVGRAHHDAAARVARVLKQITRLVRLDLGDAEGAVPEMRSVLQTIDRLRDKFEFGLKVLWDRDEIVKVIEQEDEDIHRLKNEISSQKGSTYFARMQYGRLIDGALQQRSERYVAEFLQRLRDVSVASRVNRAIGDKMIMNAAFLVQRDQEQAFDRRIKEIASLFDKLTFKYTGPWPPYNFVNIRLKLERAGQH